MTLKKGTILLNTAQLNSATNDPNTAADLNEFHHLLSHLRRHGSGALASPLVSGTTAYAGINGSANVTVSFAFVEATKNGKVQLQRQPDRPVQLDHGFGPRQLRVGHPTGWFGVGHRMSRLTGHPPSCRARHRVTAGEISAGRARA